MKTLDNKLVDDLEIKPTPKVIHISYNHYFGTQITKSTNPLGR